ncbi:MAG: hypothetical protein AABX53_04550 [Nanoarchaeota archaeon]
MNKKGIEPIVGTVFLVVAVLVSGSIVAYYTIQQVQSVDASCLEALNNIQFVDVGYSCRMPDAPDGSLTSFSVRLTDNEGVIEGFQVGFGQDGTTQSYEVTNGKTYDALCLLGSEFALPLSVPAPEDVRTYVSRGDNERLFIAPILTGGKGCFAEARKDITITNECINPAVETEMVACLGGASAVCGDGAREGTEECDGTIPDDERACTGYSHTPPYTSGTVSCVPEGEAHECEINTDACGYCGDGTINSATEACDDGNNENDDGCSSTCTVESCSVTNLAWGLTSVREGYPVTVEALLQTCGAKTLSFQVWEHDVDGTDVEVTPGPASKVVSQGTRDFVQTWHETIWGSDKAGSQTNPPEYYFKILVQGGSTYTSPEVDADELKVRACGDEIVDASDGEQCDSTNLNGQTCVSLGYTGGTLTCNARGTGDLVACRFNTVSCQGVIEQCGNNLREGSEVCDDGNEVSETSCTQYGGSQTFCNADCSATFQLTCDSCGDGTINSEWGEQCDGLLFGGATCASMGFPGGGSLTCTGSCQIDLAGCGYCGDGTIGGEEVCDPTVDGGACTTGGTDQTGGGGMTGNAIGQGSDQGSGEPGICSSDCMSCQTSDLTGGAWSQLSGSEGDSVSAHVEGVRMDSSPTIVVTVYEDDFIGDDQVGQYGATFGQGASFVDVPLVAQWDCDGVQFMCDIFGGRAEYYFIAHVADYPDILIQSDVMWTTERNPSCLNGYYQPDSGEECEPDISMGGSCTPDYGSSCNYCSQSCNVEAMQGGYCGDGTPNGPEACDGGSLFCTTDDGYLGTQDCAGNCLGYQTCSSSLYCGDGTKNGGEACDGNDVGGESCTTLGLGYTGGTLGCLAGCSGFDTSGCTTGGGQTCGNDIVEGTEECDGNSRTCTVDDSGGSGHGAITGEATGSGSGIGDSGSQTGTEYCTDQCTWSGTCVANP